MSVLRNTGKDGHFGLNAIKISGFLRLKIETFILTRYFESRIQSLDT